MNNLLSQSGLIFGFLFIGLGIALISRNFFEQSSKPFTTAIPSTHSINRGQAFGYLFHDPKWIPAIIIHSLLLIFLPTIFIAIGYELRTLRNLSLDLNSNLPDWNLPTELFSEGIKFTLYFIGLLIPALILLLSSLIPIFSAAGSFLDIVFSRASYAVAADSAKGYAFIFTFLFYVSIVYLFTMLFMLPAFMAVYSRTSKFDVRSIYTLIVRNFVSYLTLWTIVTFSIAICSIFAMIPVAGFAISLAGQFWVFTVMAHCIGQIASQRKY